MRHVRVGGTWLSSIGAYTDLTVSHTWPRGCEEVTFRMDPKTWHPKLDHGGTLLEVFNGGVREFRGHTAEPGGNGEYAAHGSFAEASGVFALDGSGNATNVPDTAIDQAIARGAISWKRPDSLSAVSWGTASDAMPLLDLLDEAMAGLGKRWWVDPDGAVRASVDPITPTYYVPHAVAGKGLTLAEDTYYSHLVGSYAAAGPVYATVTVGDANAAAWFGRKEKRVDLLGMGIITAGTATTELTNRLALVGARMGFAENLELGYGEIARGGVAVPLTMPTASNRTGGIMLRLQGVRDRIRAGSALGYTDIVIARSVYTDGAPTGTWTPLGKAPRELDELLARAAG